MSTVGNVDEFRSPLEIVFAIDTSITNLKWLTLYSRPFSRSIDRLQTEIPGIKVAVLARVTDDNQDIPVKTWVQVTGTVSEFCNFVSSLTNQTEIFTSQIVSMEVGTGFSWTSGSRHVIALIGEEYTEDVCKVTNLDWMREIRVLAEEGVVIYVLNSQKPVSGYTIHKIVSSQTGLNHQLLIRQANLYCSVFSICYYEANEPVLFNNFQVEMRKYESYKLLGPGMESLFNSFRIDKTCSSVSSPVKTATCLKSNLSGMKTRFAEKMNLSNVKRSMIGNSKIAVSQKSVRKNTTPKKRQYLTKFKESNLPLLKRENVPESNFNLRSLPWSSWRLAMARGDNLSKKNKQMWEQRFGRPGYRLKMLLPPKSSNARDRAKPVLFEMAVQGRDTSKKRYIVYSATSSCSLGVRNWERRLLGEARSQVDLVLNSGGRVYVRFCLMTSKSRLDTSRRNRRYDYAWRKMKGSRTCPRDLVKNNFVFSKSELPNN